MNDDLSFRAVYLAAHASIAALVRPLDGEAAGRQVPGCPRWTVRELVAHLAGNATAAADGTLPDDLPPSAEWTQEGVVARRDATIPELLGEWEHSISRIEDLLAAPAALDVCVHECDLREALGEPSPLDTAYQQAALSYLARVIGRRVTGADLPTVRVEAGDGGRWRLGRGEPRVRVEVGTAYEFYRCLSGRRTPDIPRGWDWGGADPEPYLPLLPLFGPAGE